MELGTMMNRKTRYEISKDVVDSALKAINEDYDLLEASGRAGGEQYDNRVYNGHFFRQTHLLIKGDMNDLSTLKQVSHLCDRFDLTTDVVKGTPRTSPDQAYLVLDWDEHE